MDKHNVQMHAKIVQMHVKIVQMHAKNRVKTDGEELKPLCS